MYEGRDLPLVLRKGFRLTGTGPKCGIHCAPCVRSLTAIEVGADHQMSTLSLNHRNLRISKLNLSNGYEGVRFL